MKPMIIIFAVFFCLAYIAIKIDQGMGWEHERAIQESYIGKV